eukprot:TRINITY_DN2148_c0_g1_i1.p2 TRINITY_DN2148_c0_g1~~TRINITY_DN2148_c0_g1_i1.p2  ORF type:complete len:250 (+),score=47.70 TRINITY_DN2148_c0_g1_i1:1005-1754(+)
MSYKVYQTQQIKSRKMQIWDRMMTRRDVQKLVFQQDKLKSILLKLVQTTIREKTALKMTSTGEQTEQTTQPCENTIISTQKATQKEQPTNIVEEQVKKEVEQNERVQQQQQQNGTPVQQVITPNHDPQSAKKQESVNKDEIIEEEYGIEILAGPPLPEEEEGDLEDWENEESESEDSDELAYIDDEEDEDYADDGAPGPSNSKQVSRKRKHVDQSEDDEDDIPAPLSSGQMQKKCKLEQESEDDDDGEE